MFAYCGNNPVMRVDLSGEGWVLTLILVTSVAIVVNHVINAVIIINVNDEVKDTYTKEEATEEIEKITGEGTVDFTDSNLKIENSTDVTSRYDRIKVSKIMQNTYKNDTKITNRTALDLSAEWYGHNLVNSIYDNDRTRDVDLNSKFADNAWYTQAGTVIFMLLGFL